MLKYIRLRKNGRRAPSVDFYKCRVLRGSKASRKPSPTKLMHNTVSNMSKPGKNHNHGALSLNIRLSNDGFAAMFNPRPLFIVLQGSNTRYEIPVTGVDPRRWAPGEEKTFTISVNLPTNVAPGTYKLGLWLPDAYTSLRGNPAYSVRFANNSTWDAATGINVLTTNFQVVP